MVECHLGLAKSIPNIIRNRFYRYHFLCNFNHVSTLFCVFVFLYLSICMIYLSWNSSSFNADKMSENNFLQRNFQSNQLQCVRKYISSRTKAALFSHDQWSNEFEFVDIQCLCLFIYGIVQAKTFYQFIFCV